MGALYDFITAVGVIYGFTTGMGAIYEFFTAIIGAHTFLFYQGPKISLGGPVSKDISSTFFYFFWKGFVSSTCDEKEANRAYNLERDINIFVCKYRM